MKVSVIVPVYNVEKYIRKCLDSCVNQTLTDIEIIVINDGSTDNSLKIAEGYADKYSNIILKSIENSGLSVARNTGLAMATGKYVYFVDSDDWMEENCLEELFNLAEKNILEVVTFDAKKAWEEGCEECDDMLSRSDLVNATKIYTGQDFVEAYKDNGGIIWQAWTLFVRKDFLDYYKIMFLPDAIYEDIKYFMDLMIACRRMMYLPQKLYNHLYRKNSIITSKVSERKCFSVYEITLGVLETIKERSVSNRVAEFWVAFYSEKMMRHLVTTFWGMYGYKEYPALLECAYDKIEQLQYACMEACYNLFQAAPKTPAATRIFLRFVENILGRLCVISSRQKALLQKIESDIQNYVTARICNLPLGSKGKRYGIYGSGNHTKFIFEQYKRAVSEITCEYIFIDTYTESYTQRMDGVDIINISDVKDEALDGIIISSFLYEKDMLELAQVSSGYSIPIYTLYDGAEDRLDTLFDEECRTIEKRILRYKEDFRRKRLFLLETPMHTNTGDYLITFAEQQFLKKYLPEYEVIPVTTWELQNNLNGIWDAVSITDIVLVNGGGFMGSQWIDGDVLRLAVAVFNCNKMIILPQSLYFEENKLGQKKANEMDAFVKKHKALTICYREETSYRRGRDLYGEEVKQYLLPDMALFLHDMERHGAKEGICLCLRTDVESTLSAEERKSILQKAKELHADVTETSMHWPVVIPPEETEKVLKEKLDELGRSELVITDALHCMISCALVGTPCIALPNVTGKIAGVYEWIKELPYIRFLEATEDLAAEMQELLSEFKEKKASYTLRFLGQEEQLHKLINEEQKEKQRNE